MLTVSHHVELDRFTAMATPAVGHQLYQLRSLDQVEGLDRYIQYNRLRFLVLGEGSNTFFGDFIDRLIVVNELKGIDVLFEDDDSVELRVASGENWHELVRSTLAQGWFGLENLALIPGTVGAAPIQNIGAYGREVSKFITRVKFFDFQAHSSRILSLDDCQFAYRDSVFKHALKDRGVITSIDLKLSKKPTLCVGYKALQNELIDIAEPTPRDVFDVVCRLRKAKLPSPSQIPNLGSFFKNPIVKTAHLNLLLQEYPDLVYFNYDKDYKLAAAWLIEKGNWKSQQYTGIKVFSNQALVITNPEHRTGWEVLHFASLIAKDIYRRFGVMLEIEPQFY